MNEKQYLNEYQPKDYPVVLVTVDTVLFSFIKDELSVLLVKRNNHPYKGHWALPGGFVDQTQDPSLEHAASRNIREKTGIDASYLEQLATLGSGKRDPRGWSVSTAYTALIPHAKCEHFVDSVDDAAWFSVDEALRMKLAFDHTAIIRLALERQHQKALYSFVPVFGLTQPFTITDLRKAHETLIGKPIQRKSFIRRFESSDMFIDTGKVRQERGRPAALYKAKAAIKSFRFVRNLDE
ncbi:NUDIX hydrolase [Reinekea sp. G2M2-21]|uniref:NUDIX hydrolase n=1 Tax=Reinekea sp. G2M2-21 TaxID=2788942 RepID=UPI0018ABDF87